MCSSDLWTGEPKPADRQIELRFWLAPAEILGSDRVEGLRLERTALVDGRVTGTGEFETLPVGMVIRSVGYRSVPLQGVPFDERASVIRNEKGRVAEGEYTAGWIKRGPSGVVGTNKSDAAETVQTLLSELGSRPRPAGDMVELLGSRGVEIVTYRHWLGLDAAERALAESLSRGESVKLGTWEAMRSACVIH